MRVQSHAMTLPTVNEQVFWSISPASSEIFDYQRSTPEIAYMGFDSVACPRTGVQLTLVFPA
jgi:hypothetical protein